MPNPTPNTSGLNKGWTDEQRARSIEVRKTKADKRWAVYFTNLQNGMRPAEAIKAAGLTLAAVRTRRIRDAEFVRMEEEAEAVGSEIVEEALRQAALDGNVNAQKMWLEKRSKERWAPEPTVVENRNLTAIEAGPRLERIAALMARLEERKELAPGEDVIDV